MDRKPTDTLSRLRVFLVLVLASTLGSCAPAPTGSLPTVLVEGGEFTMGTDAFSSTTEAPAHPVRVGSFRMGISEVTYDQFARFIRATAYKTTCELDGKGAYIFDNGHLFYRSPTMSWSKTGFPQAGDHPVTSVSWVDALHFANWLSQQDGFRAAYSFDGPRVDWDRSANGWRLPTEAEWEYAARGGPKDAGFLYSGSNQVDEVAWYDVNSGFTTHPVMTKKPNQLGLYDLTGNVYEWCWDRYARYGTLGAGRVEDPQGPPTGILRVFRGGSWYSGPYVNEEMRNTSRMFGEELPAYNYNGVRLVRNP